MFDWVSVPGVTLPPGQPSEQFMTDAFALAPADLTAATYPASAATVIPVPARGEVVVAQQIGYKPAVRGQFVGSGDKGGDVLRLMQVLTAQRQWESMASWFEHDSVVKRLDYVETRPTKGPASEPAPRDEQQHAPGGYNPHEVEL